MQEDGDPAHFAITWQIQAQIPLCSSVQYHHNASLSAGDSYRISPNCQGFYIPFKIPFNYTFYIHFWKSLGSPSKWRASYLLQGSNIAKLHLLFLLLPSIIRLHYIPLATGFVPFLCIYDNFSCLTDFYLWILHSLQKVRRFLFPRTWVLKLKFTGPVPTTTYPRCSRIEFWGSVTLDGKKKITSLIALTSYGNLAFSSIVNISNILQYFKNYNDFVLERLQMFSS